MNSSVACAAAQHTGFPPKVVPCIPWVTGSDPNTATLPSAAPPPWIWPDRPCPVPDRRARTRTFPGAAEPGLHLVDDQKNPVPAAQFLDFQEVSLISDVHAAFSLDDFQDNPRRAVRYFFLQFFEVVVGGECEPGNERLEIFPVLGVEGGAERSQSPPVKPAHGADEIGFPGGEPGEFDGRLDALRPRIAQKSPCQIARRDPDQFFEKESPGIVEEDSAAGDEPRGLFADGFEDGLIGMPQIGHP